MALKQYRVGSLTFQFEEGEQPEGAKEVNPKAGAKAGTAANKSAKAQNK